MNSIVTLKRLVELLSQASGKNMAYVDAYIRAFTDAVRSAVAAGEEVKVKGLGTFAVDPDTRAITFEPDAELAKAINEPFAMFTAEEVSPNVDDDIADPDFIFDIADPAPEPEPESIPTEIPEPIPPT
ncbi:MAG: HU family DNA-binding protein, partial [Muribaculaceae bacterium]|nr:HU family DNA-binding protein [Muribaculaceae bacterium]